MPAGKRALRQIQMGLEATHGTLVVPNRMILGKVSMRPEQELYMPDDLETGRFASFEDSEVIAAETSVSFDSSATYNQLQHFLAMAIDEITEPVPVSGVSTWDFKYDYNNANDPASYTMRYGDDIDVFEVGYIGCRQLTISGTVGDVVQIKADLFGRQQLVQSDTRVFADIALPTLERIRMANCTLRINDTWATVGNMLVPGTMVDFEWSFTTGYTPQKFADGRIDFSELAEAKRHVELSMTVAFNQTTRDWRTLFRDQTARVVEVRLDPTSDNSLKLQQSGKFTEFGELTEREGQDIVKVKFVSEYLAGASGDKDLSVELINTAGY